MISHAAAACAHWCTSTLSLHCVGGGALPLPTLSLSSDSSRTSLAQANNAPCVAAHAQHAALSSNICAVHTSKFATWRLVPNSSPITATTAAMFVTLCGNDKVAAASLLVATLLLHATQLQSQTFSSTVQDRLTICKFSVTNNPSALDRQKQDSGSTTAFTNKVAGLQQNSH